MNDRDHRVDDNLFTSSGIPLRPFYGPRPEEVSPRIGQPGGYPFTRGFHTTAYNKTPWMMQHVLGAGVAEDTRTIMDALVAEGMEGYFGHPVFNVTFDNPTKGGIDPDRPEAKGHVGIGGMSLSHLDDFRRIVRDLPLDKINFSIITGDTCITALAMYIVTGEERGYRPDQLRGNSMNWLIKGFGVDNPGFPPRNALKLMVQLIRYCTQHMPAWNTTNICGLLTREAGASAIQELGYSVAWGIALIEACIDAGLDVDAFAPRLGFQFVFHNDFFEEIAKLRALRRMWATLLHERFGAQNPKSMWARVHAHTAGDTLMWQQPENNIARVALQTLGAVLAGVQSIHACAYTEPLQIPTREQSRLALRTQQIILHESNVPKVADPLGGSWYVEELTDRVEEAAWRMIEEIDAMGGFIAAIEAGWAKGQILENMIRTQEGIRTGEIVRVGYNRYAVDDASQSRPDVFTIDPNTEREAIRRITEWKANRDQGAVKRTLEAVHIAAEEDLAGKDTLLVPVIVDAVRAHATQGEITDVLKEVYGWGFVSD